MLVVSSEGQIGTSFVLIKRCYVCKKDLPISEFYRNAAKSDGLGSRCKPCDHQLNLDRRDLAITLLGGKCASCGTDDRRVLQFDHIHDDGHLDTKRDGKSILNSIIKGLRGQDVLQLLCANCHHLKTFWDGITYAN